MFWVDIFWKAALVSMGGITLALVLLFVLRSWLKLLFLIPLIVGPYMAPSLLPEGVEHELRLQLSKVEALREYFPPEHSEKSKDFPFELLKPAEGWQVELLFTGYKGIRFMAMTRFKDLLITNPFQGELVLFRRRLDGGMQEPKVLLTNLNQPQGIALRDGWLYVAEVNRIGRIRYKDSDGVLASNYDIVIDNLPDQGGHARKSIDFGPDGALYVTIGSSCNVCIEEDPRSATIMRYELGSDGKVEGEGEIYASGLRYSVGFDWDANGKMFAVDNGRDLLGDDYPPCEFNEIVKGEFYGWPFVNGDGADDPDFGEHSARPAQSKLPDHGFRAHNAPLGMTFLKNTSEDEYKNVALVALHGSWNRTTYDGYKVVSLHRADDGSVEERDMLSGFLQNGKRIGRPVDVLEDPDGAVYITDDYSGSLLRMTPGDGTVVDTRVAKVEVVEVVLSENLEIEEAPEIVEEEKRASGKELFNLYCLRCHDDRPELIPLYNLQNRYEKYSLTQFITSPPAAMPQTDLNDDEVDMEAVVRYLLTKDIPVVADEAAPAAEAEADSEADSDGDSEPATEESDGN